MQYYTVKLSGSAAVVSVTLTDSHSTILNAKNWVKRILPLYSPVYFMAALYGPDGQLIAEFGSKVVVEEVLS